MGLVLRRRGGAVDALGIRTCRRGAAHTTAVSRHGTMIEIAELRRLPDLAGVPDAELEWLAQRLEVRTVAAGEIFVHQGDTAQLQIQLDGELRLLRRQANGEMVSLSAGDGQIGGRLPFSRMRTFAASIIAEQTTRLALLDPVHFDEMHSHTPVLLERTVQLMVDRAREFTRFGAQRERLQSLGTLSAGLAHELNNPASAARRTAHTLAERLQNFDELSSRLLREAMFGSSSDPDVDPFETIYPTLTEAGAEPDPLERSDLEDTLGDWLEAHDVPDPWQVAATLVAAGLSLDAIEAISSALESRHVADFLSWLRTDIEMRLLVRELLESTDRISELVSAMKAYSYMDQGQEPARTDIHEGLRHTLTVLRPKIAAKQLEVELAFGDLPSITAVGGELNQVWTELLDNAISAAPHGGRIEIRSRHEPSTETVLVEIHDNGPGVPPELRARIFEPFFTTRGVGDGVGLGLDIVRRIVTRRHFGSLELSVHEGDTCFTVRLPAG